jgi:Zn-dependent membrane protease YugP
MAYMGIILAGFMFMGTFPESFMWIIIATFSVMTLFQLVTLPVEYDASRRAKEQLFRLGLVHEHERAGVSKVLDAAATTATRPSSFTCAKSARSNCSRRRRKSNWPRASRRATRRRASR